MKKFVYPAVLFYDNANEQYTLAMFDIEVFCEGKTVEEAVSTAQEYLNEYIELALKFKIDIPEPTSFGIMVGLYPKNMVVLVESKVDDNNKAIE